MKRLAIGFSALALAAAAVFATAMLHSNEGTGSAATHRVLFGLVGDPADPPMAAGGTTRDRNDPGAIVIKRGDTVDFINRSGGMHQVAVYAAGLNYDQPGCAGTACANLTTLPDVTVLPITPSWGAWIAPPDGSIARDDPATTGVIESRAGAGQIALGPNPVGVAAAARQAGAIDFSYTFSNPGQYLVICNFTPHFVSYAQATFVLVTD
jgi:plastocyanin